MRNLSPYAGNDFQFHRDVIDSKRNPAADPDYKTRVSSHNTHVETKFEEYVAAFGTNELNTLTAHPFSDDNRADLLRLYSFKSKLIQELKINITTTESHRIISTCQNCTVSEVNSFDHYIPKEEFCEYVVNPKNLFPSCTRCNSFKNNLWKDEHDNFLFLNLYLDELPGEQYLFVDLEIEDNVVTATFTLDNPNSIDMDLYNLIVSHYTRLHLLKRFTENADSVIVPLENTIRSFAGSLPINEIAELIIETSQQNKLFFGHNYWKSILEIALVSDEDYLARFT
jgi:hypothetical protein